jgi:cytochrome c5
MNDANHQHQAGIRTPKQLIAAVAAGFLVPIITIVLLVQYVANADKTGAGSDAMSPEAIAARLRPVADEGFTLQAAGGASAQLKTGEAVYQAACVACHGAGVAGAPKTGDAGAWSARIAQGQATLVEHAIKGIRGMPPKGGNPNLADVEVERAVVYMANQSGGKLKEPEAATAAAPAAAAPSAAQPPAQGAQTASATPPVPESQQAKAVTGGAGKADGKKIYDAACAACHGTGVAGAPKVGDKAAWEARIKQGSATLYEHAIKGFQGKSGIMPPKGGSAASDEEVKAAVDYMVSASK